MIYTNGYCGSCWSDTYTVESKSNGNEYKTCTTCNETTKVTEQDNLVEVPE